MRSVCIILIFICAAIKLYAQHPGIIPYPSEVEMGKGQFSFDAATFICINPSVREMADSNSVLWSTLRKITGMPLRESCRGGGKFIKVERASVPSGGYQLNITSGSIEIHISDASGLHAAGQTLLQLFPLHSTSPLIPALSIRDAAAFPYRGFMLDVARHYLPTVLIRLMVDRMALL